MNTPKGWKLVPEFPSFDMVKAGSASIDDNGGNARWADIREAWADMLAAAPTPPVQQDDEALEVLRDALEAMTCDYTGDDLADSHRCGRCDRNVDGNAIVRKRIRALLAKRGAA